MSALTPSNAILHLGVGSFHRAHQAFYLHQLRATGDTSWQIVGGNLRPDMELSIEALAAQGGEYTLETISPSGEHHYTRIASIKEVIPLRQGLPGLVRWAVNPATRIISFTVTEAGYYQDAMGMLDTEADDIASDLRAVRAGKVGSTLYGAFAALLKQRMAVGAGPVTLLCCDNLRHNGDRSRSGFRQFIAELGDSAWFSWVDTYTTSPNAMVDRITPRPTLDVAARVGAATGWMDAAPVMSESFIQWVIEDRFVAGRPGWEVVGAQLVESVTPYDEAKIRMINATHSCIAWAGTLAGYQYIHEGTRDPAIRQFAWNFMTNDAIPVLSPSPVDLETYRDTTLDRFANPAICDTIQRVVMDGFSKLPGFIVPTIRDRLVRGESIAGGAVLPALFLAFLQRWHHGELAYAYQDQSMDPAITHAICADTDPVAAFCANGDLWGDLVNDPRIFSAVREASARINECEKSYR